MELFRLLELLHSVERREFVVELLVLGIRIMLGLFTLALLGSAVVASITTVLELECFTSTITTVVPATPLSASCLLFSFDIRIQKRSFVPFCCKEEFPKECFC